MDDKLKEKVLREQDKLIYFSYNAFEECLFLEHIDSDLDFGYSDFNKKFLSENLDIIPELKTKNLLYLLTTNNQDVKNVAREVIMKRVKEDGEHLFSGENVKADAWGYSTDLWLSAFNNIPKEDVPFIRDRIFTTLKELELKDSYAHSIINKAGLITSMDNFFSVYEKGVFTPEKLQFLEKLANENPNILDSTNYRIFEDSIFEMGEEFVSRIAKYPNMSNKLIMIADNNPELLDIIKQGFKDLEDSKINLPERLKIQNLVISFASRNYSDIENVTFEDIVNTSLRNEEITLDKSKRKCVPNFEEAFDKECDEEYQKLSQKYRYSENAFLNDKKRILLMKYYGITSSEAEKVLRRYSQDIDSIQLDESVKKYISDIKNVLRLENEADVDELYYSELEKITPLERLHHEYTLREAYGKTYANVLNETDDKLNSSQDFEEIDVDGKKVKKINLKGDFNLLLHSTDSGFKDKKEILDGSIKKSWREIKDTERHLASCCYINQDFLGHVPANESGVVMGFAKVQNQDIGLMGPSDIDSNIKSYDYTSNRGLYMAADNMLQNTRRVYSEIPIERRDPDYIVIFDDTSKEVLENSYKAAAEFNVPVVFIDKVEIEKEQLAKLDFLMERFEETKDLNVLQELISTYETNVAGWLLNRDPNEKDDSCTKGINNERFRNDFDEREQKIFEMSKSFLEESIKDGNNQNVEGLVLLMQKEIDKYDLVDLGNTPISKTKMKFNAEFFIQMAKNRENIVSQENSMKPSQIDLINMAGTIADDNTITKSDVDRVEKCVERNMDKEVSIDGN